MFTSYVPRCQPAERTIAQDGPRPRKTPPVLTPVRCQIANSVIPRHRHRIVALHIGLEWWLHVQSHVLGFGKEDKVRLGDLLPGQFFAAVAGRLAHHGHQRAAGHVVAGVDRLAGANGREQDLVLDVIRIAARAFEVPGVCSLDAVLLQVAAAFASQVVAATVAPTAVLVEAVSIQAHAVGILVDDRMVIEGVAVDHAEGGRTSARPAP